MLIMKAFHIIFVVMWFSGLFYLPRIFVYQVENPEPAITTLFNTMAWRLYYYITTPGAILTTLFGLAVLLQQPHYYFTQHWMHAKLSLVLLLWGYHVYCGIHLHRFQQGKNLHSSRYFRFFNEIPTLFLISIILLVVLRPELQL